MGVNIKNRLGRIIFMGSPSARTIREAVAEAMQSGTSLRGADLRGADLRNADLRNADLRGANLEGAKGLPVVRQKG